MMNNDVDDQNNLTNVLPDEEKKRNTKWWWWKRKKITDLTNSICALCSWINQPHSHFAWNVAYIFCDIILFFFTSTHRIYMCVIQVSLCVKNWNDSCFWLEFITFFYDSHQISCLIIIPLLMGIAIWHGLRFTWLYLGENIYEVVGLSRECQQNTFILSETSRSHHIAI